MYATLNVNGTTVRLSLPGTRDWQRDLDRFATMMARPLTKQEARHLEKLAFKAHEKAKAKRSRPFVVRKAKG